MIERTVRQNRSWTQVKTKDNIPPSGFARITLGGGGQSSRQVPFQCPALLSHKAGDSSRPGLFPFIPHYRPFRTLLSTAIAARYYPFGIVHNSTKPATPAGSSSKPIGLSPPQLPATTTFFHPHILFSSAQGCNVIKRCSH